MSRKSAPAARARALHLGARGVEEDRHVRAGAVHPSRELEARLRLRPPAARELDVGDHAQEVVAVALEEGPGLLEGRAQEDLRPRPHARDLLGHVEGLRDHALALVEELRVDDGQERGVVADVVLDDEDDLHPHRRRVVGGVPEVLHVLDDGEEDARVPLPEEHAVEVVRLRPGHEVAQLAHVEGEGDHRHVQPRSLHRRRELRGVHVAGPERGDDELEAPALRHLQRLRPRGGRGEPGAVVQVEVPELAAHPLADLPRLLEQEPVVGARDEEDLHHAVAHEVVEVLATPAGEGGGRQGRGHMAPRSRGCRGLMIARGLGTSASGSRPARKQRERGDAGPLPATGSPRRRVHVAGAAGGSGGRDRAPPQTEGFRLQTTP